MKDKVTWYEARDACSSEGAMLIELRTLEEYQAIRPIYGKHRITLVFTEQFPEVSLI